MATDNNLPAHTSNLKAQKEWFKLRPRFKLFGRCRLVGMMEDKARLIIIHIYLRLIWRKMSIYRTKIEEVRTHLMSRDFWWQKRYKLKELKMPKIQANI